MDWTIGKETQFPAGKSGNPGGKSKKQAQFEAALADSLVSDDPVARAQELAEIAWKAARRSEPWAVQLLFARLAPQTFTMHMETAPDLAQLRTAVVSALEAFPEARIAVARRLMELEKADDGPVQ